jgi:hypothetical protein
MSSCLSGRTRDSASTGRMNRIFPRPAERRRALSQGYDAFFVWQRTVFSDLIVSCAWCRRAYPVELAILHPVRERAVSLSVPLRQTLFPQPAVGVRLDFSDLWCFLWSVSSCSAADSTSNERTARFPLGPIAPNFSPDSLPTYLPTYLSNSQETYFVF